MENDIQIYIPNPTKHQDGLGDIKTGRLIMVVIGKGNRKRYVVAGRSTHGSNGKLWGIDLRPEKEWTGNVEIA